MAADGAPPVAAHIVVSRTWYAHHGIYVGDGKVVHYRGVSRSLRVCPVEEVSLAEFSRGRPIRVCLNSGARFDRDVVIGRARMVRAWQESQFPDRGVARATPPRAARRAAVSHARWRPDREGLERMDGAVLALRAVRGVQVQWCFPPGGAEANRGRMPRKAQADAAFGRKVSPKSTRTARAALAGTNQIACQSCATLRQACAMAAASLQVTFGMA